MWLERLRGEERYTAAVDELWPYALGVLDAGAAAGARGAGRPREVDAVERSATRPRVRRALGRDDDGAPLGPGRCAVVTAEAAVWEALAEIPDPEIPVISLVDLGVVKSVAVEAERVRIEFTPTFMGCPALDVMRARWRTR